MKSRLARLAHWARQHLAVIIAVLVGLIGGIAIYAAVSSDSSSSSPKAKPSAPTQLAGWQLNVIQLDDGTCGKNLQSGSDKTASSSATPTFLIYGDGASSKYEVAIDTTTVGTFTTNNQGNNCVTTTAALSEGPHVLTARELSPTPRTLTPFNFTVDTVPPPAPSTPVLLPFVDTGVLGDNISNRRQIGFTGTAIPGVSVRLYANTLGLGEGTTDANGKWLVVTSYLNDGIYQVHALAVDSAGNRSAFSPTVQVKIDATPPVVAITSPSAATVAGIVPVEATASDATAGIWKVAILVDSATKTTDTDAPYTYSWDTTAVPNGTHTLGAIATDIAGNITSTQQLVTVANGVAAVPTVPTQVNVKRTVTITWAQPTSDGGSPITAYRIYRGPRGSEVFLAEVGPSVRSYTDESEIGVYYQISAVNSVGESIRSTSG